MLVKTKIKQAFSSAAQSYDEVAALQRQVGRELWRKLGVVAADAILLDLGCGTGFMLSELINRQQTLPEFSMAMDIAEPMLHIARERLMPQQDMGYLCGDMEQLPFENESINIIISNLALQWCQNTEAMFSEIHRTLKPGGHFGFTTFGSRTLQELKQAWQAVDAYQHVNDFYQAQQINDFLNRTNFTIESVEVETHQINYQSVVDLMAELKQLGAHTVIRGNNPRITGKAAMQRMKTAYEQQMDSGLITATFEVITVVAKRVV
ncbi:malonyl-CoA O-methyltransferase [biofilm metagenome]